MVCGGDRLPTACRRLLQPDLRRRTCLATPLHPALVNFQVALPLSASSADAAWLAGLTADVHLGAVMMAGGLAAGLLAMGAGLVDFAPFAQSVVPHALHHMTAVGTAWLGYAIALYLRKDVLLLDATELGTASLASACLLALGGRPIADISICLQAGAMKRTPLCCLGVAVLLGCSSAPSNPTL